MHDLFMGHVAENYEDEECRQTAIEYGEATHDILHLALKMGVDHREYAKHLSSTMEFMASGADDPDEVRRAPADYVKEALGVEELMMMHEGNPGDVREKRGRVEIA